MHPIFLLTFILMNQCLLAQNAGTVNQKENKNVAELHDEFRTLDKNNDGLLDAQELRNSIAGITEDDITHIFDRFDADRDGVLTFEEYIVLVNFSSQDDKNF